MTAVTQTRMNVVLALALPAAGLAYLTSGVPFPTTRLTAAAMVATGTLWLLATVAFNIIPRPQRTVADRVQEIPDNVAQRPVLAPAYPTYVVDVSRPARPWRWTSVLLAPFELLAVVLSVPVVILLVMLPIGLAVTGVLWVARLILRY